MKNHLFLCVIYMYQYRHRVLPLLKDDNMTLAVLSS